MNSTINNFRKYVDFSLSPMYGRLQLGDFFYIGWNNFPPLKLTPTDCGDEQFGIAIGKYYAGVYLNKWVRGTLDEGGNLIGG